MTEKLRIPMLVTAATSKMDEALAFCANFDFKFCSWDQLQKPSYQHTYILNFGSERVELVSHVLKGPGPVYVDFESARNNHRRKYGGGRGEMLAKAVGLRKGIHGLHIVDATAGMAKDAFLLATLGCRVLLFERNPVIYCLLKDGIQRGLASNEPEVASAVRRLEHRFGSADFNDHADVAYIDPMFPKRDTRIQVNKEMTVFKNIVGSDADGSDLLNMALQSKVKRVVVKRPRFAEELAEFKPSHRITGKSSRFDVYVRQALK